MRDTDENEKIRHFRMGHRFFNENGSWWYTTREGEEGPFKSREQAEAAMERYVASIKSMQEFKRKHAEKHKTDSERVADPTVWDKQIDSL
jgi:hypothetical protein